MKRPELDVEMRLLIFLTALRMIITELILILDLAGPVLYLV